MQDRLQWMRMQPSRWVDWMPLCGGLQAHAMVRERYPQAKTWLVEATSVRARAARQALQAPWWQRWLGRDRLQADAPQPGQAQMLWANMALHETHDPVALLRQWHELLAVDGFVMFSCLGPDTLKELHALYAEQGWLPPSHAFTDMHDWGDMLVQAGFAEPVMDMERLTLTYDSPEKLLAELRGLGRNLHQARFAGLHGRRWHSQLLRSLESLRRSSDGRLALTVEVIYGHALKPLPRAKIAPQSTLSLQDMRAILTQTQPRK